MARRFKRDGRGRFAGGGGGAPSKRQISRAGKKVVRTRRKRNLAASELKRQANIIHKNKGLVTLNQHQKFRKALQTTGRREVKYQKAVARQQTLNATGTEV